MFRWSHGGGVLSRFGWVQGIFWLQRRIRFPSHVSDFNLIVFSSLPV